MRSRLHGAVVATGCALLLVAVSPAVVRAGSWSPRSGDRPSTLGTHARLVHLRTSRTEIGHTAARPRRAAPPIATTGTNYLTRHSCNEQRPERRSPSSERALVDRRLLARLRTSALPDRRASTATLAALAGIFYDAHAPPPGRFA
jgi:hypothetical protein